ncbi:MAG: ATP-dependent DNA helicase RecG [Chloroflexi bacterium]|nr:ATP-dependent DNA helicase RecG [Chloroflexota bacterium]
MLELERAKGYADETVIGGLDRYLGLWAKKGGADAGLTLPKPNYAALDVQGRRQWAEAVLSRLGKGKLLRSVKRAKTSQAPAASLDSPVAAISGVSSRMGAKLARLGVRTILDLLYLFPNRYLDYTNVKTINQLEVGKEQTVVGFVWQAVPTRLGRTRQGTEAVIGDGTGNVRVVWFNNPYIARNLVPNARLVISGKVDLFRGQKVFVSPEYELEASSTHTGRLVPVYPLTAGLYQRTMRHLIQESVAHYAPQVVDYLPVELRQHAQLLELPKAIQQAHFPDSSPIMEQARRRLAFDELFFIQLGVLSTRRHWQEEGSAPALPTPSPLISRFLNALPFVLTPAQERVLAEILADLASPRPMSRLLQGDVGSGKTVVAMAALLVAIAHEHQAVLMAPTEILAEQHYHTISNLIEGAREILPRPIRVCLLTGAIKKKETEQLRKAIAGGEMDLVIGTHALIQEGVEFCRLGLAVVDEQHRFGVTQRSTLRQKGFNPHVLVMSATPIPRTLALTLYGDLDLSVIDELPLGRQEIVTRWLEAEQRYQAYEFIRRQVKAGRQAFIICPLIEESPAIEARAAVAEYERLSREVFTDFTMALLHGRMKGEEKDQVMRRFRDGEFAILVSTPVVEVGIDVPNATVMLVEGADRFGLSQLHQFRGRVGRGEHKSYCLLLADSPSPSARERLALLERTKNGFLLAEEDLKMRGPGEFLGTRQSGLPPLRMAQLSDIELLELARREALVLFQNDPTLKGYPLLAGRLARLWHQGVGELS